MGYGKDYNNNHTPMNQTNENPLVKFLKQYLSSKIVFTDYLTNNLGIFEIIFSYILTFFNL